MTKISPFLFIISVILFSLTSNADDSILPPIADWHGKSEKLIVKDGHPWQTPAEKLQLADTPNYAQTISFLTELVNSDSRLQMQSLGKSPQQRDIWLVVASKEGATTQEQLFANKKPTLFIQAGIHAGEIDGKDATLMLLRDITKGDKSTLLDKVNILFIPIFNVDGHERSSEFNRVNQRGPKQMGWRTNSQNLNLNRDYAKADTVEMRVLMQAINTWQPTLYFDIHVTDGEDYQYDITYGYNREHGDSPNISRWLKNNFNPQINADLAANGHKGSDLVFGMNSMNFSEGIYGWTASPRFSNGWGDVRNLPTVLVENHSLKPYKQRVLGTYVFIESALKLLADKGAELISATANDRMIRPQTMTLAWAMDMQNPEFADFSGIEYQQQRDPLTAINFVHWTGAAKTYKNLATFWERLPKITVEVPKAYYLAPQHWQIRDVLSAQGIKFEQLSIAQTLTLTQLTAENPKFNTAPFEGHMTVNAEFSRDEIQTHLSQGWLKIPTDQDLGKLAVALLDPRGPDSLFSWGMFNQMFQKTEYIESYVMVPLARKMLRDPKLKAEFEQQFPELNKVEAATPVSVNEDSLADLFKDNSDEKMRWLYQRSKFYDKQYLKYPVLFEY